jgi:hypothetical protein
VEQASNRLDEITHATFQVEDLKLVLENRSDKQQAGTCVRKRCTAKADGSDFCPRHEALQRKYNREYDRQRRADAEAAGDCTRCCKVKAKSGSKWCAGCLIRLDRLRKSDHKPLLENRQNWRVDPGTNWNRFRGKGRRGRLTREEQDREDERDLKMAIEYAGRAMRGIPVARSEGEILPRLQRSAAWRELGALAGAAERILRDFRRKCGLGDVAEGSTDDDDE